MTFLSQPKAYFLLCSRCRDVFLKFRFPGLDHHLGLEAVWNLSAATFPVCSLSSTLLSCAVVLDDHMGQCAPGLDPLLILQWEGIGCVATYTALQGSGSWKHNVRWCWETGLVLGKPGLTDKTMTFSSEAFSTFSRKEEQEAFGEVLPTFYHERKSFFFFKAETKWIYRTLCQGGRNTAFLPPSLLHYFLLSTKHL